MAVDARALRSWIGGIYRLICRRVVALAAAYGATAPAAGEHHHRRELSRHGHRTRRALRAMVAAATNPMAASGRPTYQRSRSRPRVRR